MELINLVVRNLRLIIVVPKSNCRYTEKLDHHHNEQIR